MHLVLVRDPNLIFICNNVFLRRSRLLLEYQCLCQWLIVAGMGGYIIKSRLQLVTVGGHLAALRRTRVGAFDLSGARTLPELETAFTLTPLDVVAASAFSRRDLDAEQALALSHGAKLSASGIEGEAVAAFGPDGALVALLEDRGEIARALAVFVG